MTLPPDTPPSAEPSREALPRAHVQRRRRSLNLVWLIPIATLGIGLYLAWDSLSQRGPTIEISFQTAEGLKAGQSQIRHKDVVLGTVQSIRLSDDYSHAIVTAEMRRDSEPMLTDTARFWVVKARFFAGNVQGLDTLLSGAYIDLLPGARGAIPRRSFVGLEDPPVLQSDTPGRTVLVRAARLGSVSIGSPVYYRDLSVGQVLGWDLDDQLNYAVLHVFVRSPFDKRIVEHTHFWNASGFSVQLAANGIQVQLESLRAVLEGGVAFDSPVGPDTKPAAPETVFTLYNDQEAADSASYEQEVSLVSYFQGNVRGLTVGSPVEIYGIKIGQVTDIGLRYDPELDRVVVPVHYTVQPGRIAGTSLSTSKDVEKAMSDFVGRGLRASLGSSSLITGTQLISIGIDPNAEPATIRREGNYLVMPTTGNGSGLESIEISAAKLLTTINGLPFRQIGQNLNNALAGIAGIANGADLQKSLKSLQETMNTVQGFIQKLDRDASPAVARLPAISQQLQDSLAHANKLLASVDAGYGGDSRFKRDLDQLMAQLNETANSIRVLADLLTRHPEALIRGRPASGSSQ